MYAVLYCGILGVDHTALEPLSWSIQYVNLRLKNRYTPIVKYKWNQNMGVSHSVSLSYIEHLYAKIDQES